MADQWIDEAYVDARMGEDVRVSLTQEQSVDLTAFIESATGRVQGILRAAGYTTPATVECELCKLAVYAVMFRQIAESPANNLQLPENWAQSSAAEALIDLREGNAHPNLALASTGAAIGGWTVSDDGTSGVSSTSRVARATREQLRGY